MLSPEVLGIRLWDKLRILALRIESNVFYNLSEFGFTKQLGV